MWWIWGERRALHYLGYVWHLFVLWQLVDSLFTLQRTIEFLWRTGAVLFFNLISSVLSCLISTWHSNNKKNTKSPPPLQLKRKRKANVTLKHYCKHKESIIPCHGYNLEWHIGMNYLFEFLTGENKKWLMKSREALGVQLMKPLVLWKCQDGSVLLCHSQDGTYLWPHGKIRHWKNCRLKWILTPLSLLCYLNIYLGFL